MFSKGTVVGSQELAHHHVVVGNDSLEGGNHELAAEGAIPNATEVLLHIW